MKLSLQCVARGMLLAGLCVAPLSRLFATDFILTIGGGYRPESNQASLEANVLFFEQVLQSQHTGRYAQDIFFANGNNPKPDLQILSPAVNTDEATLGNSSLVELLEALYGSPSNDQTVEYRKHEIAHVTGPNLPANIHASLRRMCDQMTEGDRLLVYVTAHGGESKGRNHYNTTISCWDGESITASEFEKWLGDVPSQVPVIMVMAQCYCGGFAHTIFRNVQPNDGLSSRLRVGFFAQQHDLPAAGCRPDIENDEEYSSFFWGAFTGQSRGGKPMPSADFNRDNRISFAEAHAHAVLTSQTIDIPLRSSEALLRAYSRIGGGYDHRRDLDSNSSGSNSSGSNSPSSDQSNTASETADDDASSNRAVLANAENGLDDERLASMTGTLRELTRGAEPELQQTVIGLAQQLEIELDDDVPVVFMRFEDQRDNSRELRRSNSRGRRRGGSSGRRQLRTEISQQWPELTSDKWFTSELLQQADQRKLMQQIAELPSYKPFTDSLRQRKTTQHSLEQAELREVKFQRLINTLEAIVLARNLEQFAEAEVVAHYRAMIALEQTGLNDLAQQ